jgi:hypothetical protein
LVTRKSWLTLQNLRGKLDFVLIGGWAVFLYTKSLKSKDIDLIVDYGQLEKLRTDFKVVKNDRLKKYEARNDEVQIDVYLPHFSDFGIPVEEIIKGAVTKETFIVPRLEKLLILKQLAYIQRGLSAKGQKDRIDILSLAASPDFNPDIYKKELTKTGRADLFSGLKKLITQTVKIPEIGINEHFWSRAKKKILEGLKP